MKRGRNVYWTRERCVAAGAAFYREKGIAPTNEDWWLEQTQFTAATPDGLAKGRWGLRPYPSNMTLKRYWRGMRAFWEDVRARHPDLDIRIDAGDLPWSPAEEWFIVESVGILPRSEVAELLGRTEPAIKRRLYELGVNSYNRWGWTVQHLARVTGVSQATIMRYVDAGRLPVFRGHKCIYVEPADFLVIEEYNWAKKRHPKELREAVMGSLVQRLCHVLLRFDYRRYSYHRPEVGKVRYAGRIKQRRKVNTPAQPPPSHIKVGDWVRITGEPAKYYGHSWRVGRVKSICWSPCRRRRTQKSPERPPCWVATVEFAKRREPGLPEMKRLRVNVDASGVGRVRKPYERKKPLKPRPRRQKRKARMERVGARVRNNRLNLPALP